MQFLRSCVQWIMQAIDYLCYLDLPEQDQIEIRAIHRKREETEEMSSLPLEKEFLQALITRHLAQETDLSRLRGIASDCKALYYRQNYLFSTLGCRTDNLPEFPAIRVDEIHGLTDPNDLREVGAMWHLLYLETQVLMASRVKGL